MARRIVIVAALLGVLVAGLSILGFYTRGMPGAGGKAFPREYWIEQGRKPATDNRRNQMLAALRPRLRHGLRLADVEMLLGRPDRIADDGRTITYKLGLVPYGVDYHYLLIAFDSQGRLERHWIKRD